MMHTSLDAPTASEEAVNHFIHAHCQFCVKVAKCVLFPKGSDSCDIISCVLNCGSHFHACKLSEHRLLCANEKVSCINVGNGCPVVLPRCQQAQHLETCPASVVICTMEWNRWPMCYQGKQMCNPLIISNSQVKQCPLDVALALRDQRMLSNWLKVPCETRRILKNELTQFPAVPLRLHSQLTPDGCSVKTAVLKACEKSTQIVDSPGLQGICSTSIDDRERESQSVTSTLYADVCAETSCTKQCNSVQDEIPLHKLHGQLPIDKPQIIEMHSLYSCTAKESQVSNISDSQVASPTSYKIFCKPRPNNINSCGKETYAYNGCEKFPQFSDKAQSTLCLPLETDAISIVPPPPPGPPQIVALGLNLTLESITRYQNKPKNMYTFLCAQEFRRDEYSWHYKNVHSDIHGGLNGWLEHRCPLAVSGCMYSLSRLYPSTKGSVVVHSDVLESFGVKPRDCRQDSLTSLSLCSLPFEVLRHICRFLDSFSLNNLALTSRLLRDVCSSLLEERGIVVVQWKKKKIGSKVQWSIAYKRWFFSTAFTPVKTWGFEAEDNMSDHLRSCIFFERNVPKKPYFHLLGCEPSPDLKRKLSYASVNNEEEE